MKKKKNAKLSKPTIVVSREPVVDDKTGRFACWSWCLDGPWGQRHYLQTDHPNYHSALQAYCKEVDWPYSNIQYQKLVV
jgi:hypothetical protein